MLTRTLERILTAMGSSEGHIHLLDQAGTILRLAAQQGVPPDIAIQITSTPLHQGLAGWVVKYGEPLLVPNMAAEIEKLHSSPGRDSHTYAGAPMRAGGQIVGVLCVIREAEQQFSVEEVALLSSIADQVGVMVENSRLRRQAEHAAVMEERERLARELHDSVTQSLYSLTLLAGGGRRMANAGTLTDVADYFTDFGEIAQQALKEMRLLVYELRPAILEREGLVGALQQRLDSVEGRAGVEARLLVEEMIQLPPTVEEDLYRIAQEALNNALKHAAATSVTVRIYADQDQLVMEVIDDGKGFNPEALSDMGGMGLVSIRQRAERLGGRLKVMSAPEDGTTVQVRVTRI
jgi:signal transduction histidine kinase